MFEDGEIPSIHAPLLAELVFGDPFPALDGADGASSEYRTLQRLLLPFLVQRARER